MSYEALLAMWERIRQLEAENKALRARIWDLEEGWDPGQ